MKKILGGIFGSIFIIMGITLIIIFGTGCSKGEVADYDAGTSNEVNTGWAEKDEVKRESPTSYTVPDISEGDWDTEFFSPIRERILCSSIENGYRIYQPKKGDTLANIVWSLYGKGPNVAKIRRIAEDNNHITDPNLLSLRYPIKIYMEE